LQVGTIVKLKNKLYVVVNKQGSLEKLNEIKWWALLYLEILQGLNIYMSLPKLRVFIKKYKKEVTWKS